MSALKNVKLYYFSQLPGRVPTFGRGENVRLLLEDSGIDFEYIRVSHEQWKEEKPKLEAQKIRGPTMPYITIDGKYYGKTGPILQLLAHKLDRYDGSNEDEVHDLRVYADLLNDWLVKWVKTLFGNPTEEFLETYKNETCPDILKTWEEILSDTQGPFLLGDKVSYPDFNLFHMLEDDANVKVSKETHPHIIAFVEGMKNRPNLKKYLATERK